MATLASSATPSKTQGVPPPARSLTGTSLLPRQNQGGTEGAQQAGKMRLEGKSYVVLDGDVMHFRFAT